MIRHVVLFEDERVDRLAPFTINRPVYDLRCGILTLRDKVKTGLPGFGLAYHVREFLKPWVEHHYRTNHVNRGFQSPCLLLNGRVLWNANTLQSLARDAEDMLYVCKKQPAAVRLDRLDRWDIDWSRPLQSGWFSRLPTKEIDALWIEYPWDLIYRNPEQIHHDSSLLGCNGAKDGDLYPGVHLIEEHQITVAERATIKPGAVLDAEKGPIVIDEGALVMSLAAIQGPAYIGKRTQIKMGAKIFPGSSFGEMCKVGGEVEQSVIHSFSNKGHEGYLGHSYLGQWVNLGADTNTSNLQNNYGLIHCMMQGEKVATGLQFLGLMIGDHSKSAISTVFNTATMVGVGTNVYGSTFPPRSIPSFVWGGSEGFVEYRFDKFVESAARMMARRSVELSEIEKEVLYRVFKEGETERSRFLQR